MRSNESGWSRMTTETRLVLWDIDGTLVRGGRTLIEAYNRALRAVYALSDEVAHISTAGKTDPQIAVETLALHGLTADQAFARLEEFRDVYAREVETVREGIAADLIVLPGVREVLEILGARGIHQSLLTGNFEATARLKLECAGLDSYFDFAAGAYGSDHHDRDRLVPVAVAKVQARGVPVTLDRTLVIGDTPRDVACARAGGARILAVATGRYSVEDLTASRPDALLPDLRDVNVAVETVRQLLSE